MHDGTIDKKLYGGKNTGKNELPNFAVLVGKNLKNQFIKLCKSALAPNHENKQNHRVKIKNIWKISFKRS